MMPLGNNFIFKPNEYKLIVWKKAVEAIYEDCKSNNKSVDDFIEIALATYKKFFKSEEKEPVKTTVGSNNLVFTSLRSD